MTRLKDQIRLAKKALKIAQKKPELFTPEELQYMALQLVRAKIALKEKQLRRKQEKGCLLYTSPSPRDATLSRMPSSA